MNLHRSLSRQQWIYLRAICSGHIIVAEGDAYEKYAVFEKGKEYPGVHVMSRPNGKMRSGPFRCGGHMYSSVTELVQRGILVLEEGRWVPNKTAQRQLSALPKLSFPPRPVTMNRTRPARVQKDQGDGQFHVVSSAVVSGAG